MALYRLRVHVPPAERLLACRLVRARTEMEALARVASVLRWCQRRYHVPARRMAWVLEEQASEMPYWALVARGERRSGGGTA